MSKSRVTVPEAQILALSAFTINGVGKGKILKPDILPVAGNEPAESATVAGVLLNVAAFAPTLGEPAKSCATIKYEMESFAASGAFSKL